MKARVKATGEIVEVVYNGFYYESIKDERVFDKSELEIMSQTKDPDYWTKLEHQYAGIAMQGIITNPIGFGDLRARHEDEEFSKVVAEIATDYAHALVEKMKEKRK